MVDILREHYSAEFQDVAVNTDAFEYSSRRLDWTLREAVQEALNIDNSIPDPDVVTQVVQQGYDRTNALILYNTINVYTDSPPPLDQLIQALEQTEFRHETVE